MRVLRMSMRVAQALVSSEPKNIVRPEVLGFGQAEGDI